MRIWECRYFVEGAPAGLPERLASLLGAPDGPFADEDVYLVGNSGDTNVKVRQRTGTLKVKTCVERKDDGFELWLTTADSPLPASRAAWEDALRRLGVAADPGELARLAAGASLDELCASQGVACVRTSKRRLFYAAEAARVEVADVTALERAFTSISFEAADLARARELRAAADGETLGEPESYASIAVRLQGEKEGRGARRTPPRGAEEAQVQAAPEGSEARQDAEEEPTAP